MKVARDITQFEFDIMRPSCQRSLEDEKDIYVTSLTDMMRKLCLLHLEKQPLINIGNACR